MILRHAFEPVDNRRLAQLCGPLDEHLRAIERALQVTIARRQAAFRVQGRRDAATTALGLLQALYAQAAQPIDAERVQLALAQARAQATPSPASAPGVRREPAREPGRGAPGPAHGAPAPAPAPVVLHTRRADLAPRTPNQARYLQQILGHDLTFGIGPAGTGKTFLAVACAVDALERSAVQRIVLTRPAVEAGERLGFLPGDLAQKVDPYLRPLYDALYDLMGLERVTRAFERGELEVAPLAFMRGRTLNHAFVILDEAQNTTPEQMKMFLTRIGFGARCVVTGDVSQIDLPRGRASGLVEARRVLARVDGVAFTDFDKRDVVRHPLIARIVAAYDAAALEPADAAAADGAAPGRAAPRRAAPARAAARAAAARGATASDVTASDVAASGGEPASGATARGRTARAATARAATAGGATASDAIAGDAAAGAPVPTRAAAQRDR